MPEGRRTTCAKPLIASVRLLGSAFLVCAVALISGATSRNPSRVTFASIDAHQEEHWEARATYPIFAGNSPVYREASRVFRRDALKVFRDHVKALNYVADVFHQTAMEFELSPCVSIVDPDFVSAYFEWYADFGGDGPHTCYLSHTFTIRHGRAVELRLKDLLLPGVKPGTVMRNLVSPLFQEREEDNIDGLIGAEFADHFVVTPSGITWLFNQGDVVGEAGGPIQIKAPWGWLEGYIDPNGPLKPVLQKKTRVK